MIYDFGVEDDLAELVSTISQRNRLNLTGTSAKEEELSFDLSLTKLKKNSKSMSRLADAPQPNKGKTEFDGCEDILNTSRQSTRLRERAHMYSTAVRIMKRDIGPTSPSASSQAFNKLTKKLAPNLGYAFMDETAAELCVPLCDSQESQDVKDQSQLSILQSVTENADESFLPESKPMPVFTSTQESDVPCIGGGAENANNIVSGYNLRKLNFTKTCSIKLIDVVAEQSAESSDAEYCDAVDDSFVSMVDEEVQTSPIERNNQTQGTATSVRSQSPPAHVFLNSELQLPDLIPCCSLGSVKKCWSERVHRSTEKCNRRSARLKRAEDEDQDGQNTPNTRKGGLACGVRFADETPGRKIELASPHVTRRLSSSASLDDREKKVVGLRRGDALNAPDANILCAKKRKSIHIIPNDFTDRLNSLKADVRACFFDETKISQHSAVPNEILLPEQREHTSHEQTSPRRSQRRKSPSNKGHLSNRTENCGTTESISQSFRPEYTSTQNPNSVNVITIKRFSPGKARMVKQSIVVKQNAQASQVIDDENNESEEEIEMVAIGCQTTKIDTKTRSTAVDSNILENLRSRNYRNIQEPSGSGSTHEQDMNVTEQLCVSLKKRIDQRQNTCSNRPGHNVDGFKQSKDAASPFTCRKKLNFAFKKQPSMSNQNSQSNRTEVSSKTEWNLERAVGYSKESINSMSDAEFYEKFCLKYLGDVHLERK